MQKKWISLMLALLMLTTFASCSEEPPVMPQQQNSVPTERKKPDVQDNFYGYANFDYFTTAQLPNDKDSIDSFDIIGDQMKANMAEMLEQMITDNSDDPYEQMVREFYQQYMDNDAREKAGADQLLGMAGMIDGCKTVDELIDVMGIMYQQFGVSSMFNFSVKQDYYDSSLNRLMMWNMNTCGNMKENFTKTDAGSDNIGNLTTDTLNGIKVDASEVRERAKAVVKMVYDIMYHAMDSEMVIEPERHYNLFTIEQFDEHMTNVNVKKLMKAFGLDVKELVVYDLPQAEQINVYFTEEHLRQLKDYTLACLLNEYRDVLPKSMYKDFSKEDSSSEDAEKKARNFVGEHMEYLVGHLYGRKYCTDEISAAAEQMTGDLKKSCHQLIENCERLSENGKKQLLKKLDSMVFLLGYNKDYKPPYNIIPAKDGGTLIDNLIAIKVGTKREEVSRLSEKGNRLTWDMSPIQSNAVYNPMVNTVTIPAVMLNTPSFDPSASEYHNLGRVGTVIAHEMNHAFDSNGIRYNETGCFTPEWISQEDMGAYYSIQKKAIDLFDSYKLLDVYSVDGEQTLTENLADLGSLQCVLNTTKDKEQQKEIFEAYAEQWTSLSIVSEAVDRISNDVHSPPEARVNVVVSCMDEFYDVYDIKETGKMYVAPEKRVKVW